MELANIKVIAVDKGVDLTERLKMLFEQSDVHIFRESSMDHVLERFESESFDVLILTSSAFKAGEIDGVELLDVIAANSPMTQVLFLAEARDIRTAMSALKAGTYQYAKLPISDEELRLLIETAVEKRPLYGTNLLLESKRHEIKLEKLVGRSAPMKEVYRQIRQAAATSIPVLLLGETGTGKDLAAQAIHQQSERRNGPYIPVNLGSLPTELVASELFGHEKGTFTGALERRQGKFELARGGTVFLDEIATVCQIHRALDRFFLSIDFIAYLVFVPPHGEICIAEAVLQPETEHIHKIDTEENITIRLTARDEDGSQSLLSP